MRGRKISGLEHELAIWAHGLGLNLRGLYANPKWVEWLMGWPAGWTDYERLETAKYQQWLSAHGGN
jgi:hypothetical protein